MKRTRTTPETKAKILAEMKEGRSVADLSKQYGVSTVTIYSWTKKVKKAALPAKQPELAATKYSVAADLIKLADRLIERSFRLMD